MRHDNSSINCLVVICAAPLDFVPAAIGALFVVLPLIAVAKVEWPHFWR